MNTQGNAKQLYFQGLGPRKVVGSIDGGTITSDAGALLLREVDRANNFFGLFSSCLPIIEISDLWSIRYKQR